MDDIIELFTKYGDSEYLGECVSKTEHMIQVASLAKKNDEPDYVVLACLLHDIGHFIEEDNMDGLGVIEHGMVGANYLRNLGMDERVCNLVENHIYAKRYLVTTDKLYYNCLSSASKSTLEYQGGFMSENEIIEFKNKPDYQKILQVRIYDDKGKELGKNIPKLENFYQLIKKGFENNRSIIYHRKELLDDGLVYIKDFFTIKESEQIVKFKNSLDMLKAEKGKWMIYYENDGEKEYKSRIENFINFLPEIKQFLKCKVEPFLKKLCETDIVLFKDKINWKLPGGKSFKAHQDHAAWNDFNITRFYSVALFGNNSTIENGCLEMVRGNNNKGLFSKDGLISNSLEESFDWTYLETTPRDLVIFDSFIPHRSACNNTNNSRNIFYFTYNKSSEGDYYKEYNQKKRIHFPPKNERDPNINYCQLNNKYNLGNPII